MKSAYVKQLSSPGLAMFMVWLALILCMAVWGPSARAISRVAILDSRLGSLLAADQRVDEDEAWRERPLLWQNLLRGLFDHVDVVSGERLEGDALQGYDLLVVPDTSLLTPQQKEVVLGFLRRGNSVILTARSGAESTSERDPDSLARALSLTYHPVEPSGASSSISWWVVMDQPSYLSAGIPVLQHLAVEAPLPVAASGSARSLAFWMETGESDEDFGSGAARSAIRYGRFGEGRFLWLGFTIDGVGGDLATSHAFHQLLSNATSWFRGQAVVEMGNWPHPHQAAVIFSMDTETAFGNLYEVNALENLDYITYFLLTDAAGLYTHLLREIASRRREGTATAELAVHGDNHDVFRGESRSVQTARLRRTRHYIEEETGMRPVGFRPPEEAYDYATLQSLVDTGFTYIFADDNPIRNTPRVIEVENQRLVQFPMLNLDDIKTIVLNDWPEPEEVLDVYLRDMGQIFSREGLYMANLHTHVLAGPNYIGVLRDLVDYTVAQGVWQTNCRQMVDWWLRRGAVDLGVRETRDGTLRFRVVNDGIEMIENLSLSLWLPEDARQVRLEVMPAQRRIVDYRQDGNRIIYSVPVLMAGDGQEYRLTWQR